MERKKRVAIIIINYNHAQDTIKCLESILKSEYENFQVFVVDNGSEQSDLDILYKYCDKFDKIKVLVLTPNQGYVGGVNFGLKHALDTEPDYFLIMNNDTILDKNAVNELVLTALKYKNECIVSGKVYNMDAPETLQYIGQWCRNHKKFDYPPYIKGGHEKDNGQYNEEMEMGMLDDIFWLLPLNVFKKVGYYSTYFFLYGEQNDYALRAAKEGYKFIYTPKAKIWHYHHLTTANGQKMSQVIDYWRAFAVLVLVYLHQSKKDYLVYYFKNGFKILCKALLFRIFSKTRYNNIKPTLYAYFYYTKWFYRKVPNKGYNPFLQKK